MEYVTDLVLCVVVCILCAVSGVLSVKFFCRKMKSFDSRITGFYIIPASENNPEIVLRELIQYLSANEINCFRKIYIKVNSCDSQIISVCRKICCEYPVFEIYENSSNIAKEFSL